MNDQMIEFALQLIINSSVEDDSAMFLPLCQAFLQRNQENSHPLEPFSGCLFCGLNLIEHTWNGIKQDSYQMGSMTFHNPGAPRAREHD